MDMEAERACHTGRLSSNTSHRMALVEEHHKPRPTRHQMALHRLMELASKAHHTQQDHQQATETATTTTVTSSNSSHISQLVSQFTTTVRPIILQWSRAIMAPEWAKPRLGAALKQAT